MMMYSIKELKPELIITNEKIECPVLGCNKIVDRRKRINNDCKSFVCDEHGIIITTTTFIYQDLKNNLVCEDDILLLNQILGTKRESRLENENSEDAVSWNVFRYLEKKNLLLQWLNKITNETYEELEVMYWSHCSKEEETYPLLKNARKEFGEIENQGSEPDIIIKTDKTLFFIEAKLFSSNKTSGTGETLRKRINNKKKYEIGSSNLFAAIFNSDYEKIVIDQKYELMRFWLLGYWMAKQKELNFQLINLVLDRNEKEIENDFGKYLKQDNCSKFSRQTWESIYYFIKENGDENDYKEKVLSYFENKAAGYNSNGFLKNKAFDV